MAKISINIQSGTVDEQKKDVIVGIDLGTTNSLVAYIEGDQPIAVTDPNGKNTLVPSVINFNSEGQVIVGDEAKEYLISDPQNTIYSVKRLMGRSYKDIVNAGRRLGYKIIRRSTFQHSTRSKP